MIKAHTTRCISGILSLSLSMMLIAPATAFAAQPTVNLGAASSYAILAGSTITNTGATTVNGSAGGDIGLFPGTDFPGQADVTVSGAVHLADTAASEAKDALIAAYNDAAGRTPVTRIATELGGQILKPGVYDSASGTFQITGTLRLDAEGDPDAVFIFKTASTLITASGSRVTLTNGARFCRTFWKVGSSATLGTNSRFVGHIFALTSITARTGAFVQGQLLARNGAVTLDRNTITNGICADVGQVPLIRVRKTASPSAEISGTVAVTYTYTVTNPGMVALTDVSVSDDKISQVDYVSGDVNEDQILQTDETWIYTASDVLDATTTNIATAEGTGAGERATDAAFVRVTVTPSGGGVDVTVTGGRLPSTATPWYEILLGGLALMVVGLLGYKKLARPVRD